MNFGSLKDWAKKHQTVYSFLWGMPLYRKVMSCVHNRLKLHLKRENLSAFGAATRAADMFLCLWIYGCSYSEYNLYGFDKLTHHERKEYIGDCCRKWYYMQFNNVADMDIFRNKYRAYQEFGLYYGREAWAFHTEEGIERFREIIGICGTAMVKPVTASGGYGVMKVSADPESMQSCFDTLYRGAPAEEIIIEEYVLQAPELSALHPASLNTARIITVLDKYGDPHILGTLFRIGKNGMVVDNGASGGILCALSDDGVITQCMDKKSHQFYSRHPDTNHQLIGFEIPHWDEAKAFALKLARIKSGVRYCGWDLALTDSGWIMIEGNEGAELAGIQIFGGGCKSKLKSYLQK